MNDEERAEKYIRTDGTNGEKAWQKIHKEFPNCIVVKSTESKKRLLELFLEYAKVLFLDGLAEGKPKWHDLRKNPDDLPQRSGLYCVQCGEVREFDKEEKSWFTVNFDPCMNRTEETYLWCELPKWEE